MTSYGNTGTATNGSKGLDVPLAPFTFRKPGEAARPPAPRIPLAPAPTTPAVPQQRHAPATRPRVGGPGQAAKARWARLTDTGHTAAQLRTWAAAQGIHCPRNGTPSTDLIDAYLQAHQEQQP